MGGVTHGCLESTMDGAAGEIKGDRASGGEWDDWAMLAAVSAIEASMFVSFDVELGQ